MLNPCPVLAETSTISPSTDCCVRTIVPATGASLPCTISWFSVAEKAKGNLCRSSSSASVREGTIIPLSIAFSQVFRLRPAILRYGTSRKWKPHCKFDHWDLDNLRLALPPVAVRDAEIARELEPCFPRCPEPDTASAWSKHLRFPHFRNSFSVRGPRSSNAAGFSLQKNDRGRECTLHKEPTLEFWFISIEFRHREVRQLKNQSTQPLLDSKSRFSMALYAGIKCGILGSIGARSSGINSGRIPECRSACGPVCLSLVEIMASRLPSHSRSFLTSPHTQVVPGCIVCCVVCHLKSLPPFFLGLLSQLSSARLHGLPTGRAILTWRSLKLN